MENMSHRHSSEDTTTSMYLSFDAESTISTACYKTLEAMDDISALSEINMDDSINRNETEYNRENSTLEVNDDFQNISPLKTVKKIEIPDVKLKTPLRALQKSIFSEYKALCSTPSKQQLLKTIDVTRGSDATRCVDFGLAFLGVEDGKSAYFPPPPAEVHGENKENIFLDAKEISALSTCSSGEITSVTEKKMLTSISTIGSISESETFDEGTIIKNKVDCNNSEDIVDQVSDVYCSVANNGNNSLKPGSKTADTYRRGKCDTKSIASIENMEHAAGITKQFFNTKDEDTPVDKDLDSGKIQDNKKSASKPKIAVFAQNARRSVCEPNLQTNKPSRICNSDVKRRSLLPTCKKSTLSMNAEAEIPLLISKMLKITETPMKTKNDIAKKENKLAKTRKDTNPSNKSSNVTPKKVRASLAPSNLGNKRSYNFTQRMSVVVRTTLNSPACKIARKSSIGGTMSTLQRRSVIPQKISTSNSNISKIQPRKTIVPKPKDIKLNAPTKIETADKLKETTINVTNISQRKSFYTSSKFSEKDRINYLSHNKPDVIYTCNICKEKFRIKSLLDAHKRSHENDNQPPAFIKKPSAITRPATSNMCGNLKQCKYCDKKFALLKALHIHLLQNCSKIPPAEKRKLQYTDLNHEEKAQLPNVFQHNNSQANASNTVSYAVSTPRHTVKQSSNLLAIPFTDPLEAFNENKVILDTQKGTVGESTVGAPLITGQKVKRTIAHAGVYRTPSKLIHCHLCKLTFRSILDYTTHNLTTHGNQKVIVADDVGKCAGKNVSTKSF